jgi:uncharacterized protein YpuA (DUF1002 family)
MRWVIKIIFCLSVLSCSQGINDLNEDEANSNFDTLKRYQIKDTELTKKPVEIDVSKICNSLNLIENKHEIIVSFFQKKQFYDSIYKFFPFCLDVEYQELFDEICFNEFKKKPDVFFSYISENEFSNEEINKLLSNFSQSFFDRYSNITEEKNQDISESMLKMKIDEFINIEFNNTKVETSLLSIKNQLRDSTISCNNKYFQK